MALEPGVNHEVVTLIATGDLTQPHDQSTLADGLEPAGNGRVHRTSIADQPPLPTNIVTMPG